MKHKFITIEGNIGAGKTTLTKKIAEEYNARILLEQFSDNPFLPKFYQNPEKYSFILEMSFLADRYIQLKNDLQALNLFQPFLISDYYFSKSLIFAKTTLKNDEYKLYRKLFNIIYKSLPKPDLYVYLHVDIEKLLLNIHKRGRDYEQTINKDYLKKINNNYFDYFKQQADISFLIIDTSGIDFVNYQNDYEKIKNTIFNNDYPKGISRIEL